VVLLSKWIPYPHALDGRSIREHHLIDEIVTDFPNNAESRSYYDAIIEAPGPQYILGHDMQFADIYFGGSLPVKLEEDRDQLRSAINDNVRLIVLREPESMKGLTKYHISTPLYMMGDLANVYEPAWPIVKYWKEAYQTLMYPNVTNIVFARQENFFECVEMVDNETILLHPFSAKATPIHLSTSNTLFVSNSVVEDGELWKDLQTEVRKIEGIRPGQFLMVDTIEQLFAITSNAENVYTQIGIIRA